MAPSSGLRSLNTGEPLKVMGRRRNSAILTMVIATVKDFKFCVICPTIKIIQIHWRSFYLQIKIYWMTDAVYAHHNGAPAIVHKTVKHHLLKWEGYNWFTPRGKFMLCSFCLFICFLHFQVWTLITELMCIMDYRHRREVLPVVVCVFVFLYSDTFWINKPQLVHITNRWNAF